MVKLKWTEEAFAWLHRIYEYIADDNPQAAANVVNGIHEKAAYFGNILNWVTFFATCLKVKYGYYHTATIVSHTRSGGGGHSHTRRFPWSNGYSQAVATIQ